MLSHVDEQGKARMVDISAKPETRRRAVAGGRVQMRPETVALIERREITKGDVLAVAKVAAREVERLERMTPASPEYQMIRTYFDWVLDVPWSVTTEDRLDPVAAAPLTDAGLTPYHVIKHSMPHLVPGSTAVVT